MWRYSLMKVKFVKLSGQKQKKEYINVCICSHTKRDEKQTSILNKTCIYTEKIYYIKIKQSNILYKYIYWNNET